MFERAVAVDRVKLLYFSSHFDYISSARLSYELVTRETPNSNLAKGTRQPAGKTDGMANLARLN
jgi:hypothetical protein